MIAFCWLMKAGTTVHNGHPEKYAQHKLLPTTFLQKGSFENLNGKIYWTHCPRWVRSKWEQSYWQGWSRERKGRGERDGNLKNYTLCTLWALRAHSWLRRMFWFADPPHYPDWPPNVISWGGVINQQKQYFLPPKFSLANVPTCFLE